CPAAVARAHDAAHVHVDVERAVARHRDRAHTGRIAPGGVPRIAAVGGIERFDACEPVPVEPQEMRLFGSDQETTGRWCEACRLRFLDRRTLTPSGVDSFPERASAG